MTVVNAVTLQNDGYFDGDDWKESALPATRRGKVLWWEIDTAGAEVVVVEVWINGNWYTMAERSTVEDGEVVTDRWIQNQITA